MDLPPLRPGDGWQRGRFQGLAGKRRFFLEFGGGCRCPCDRPGEGHWAEAEDATQADFVARMAQV
jgi:hypothetical protein